MRRLLIAAVIATSIGSLGAGSASAVCNPDYRPLCLSSCPPPTFDPHDPIGSLIVACPA